VKSKKGKLPPLRAAVLVERSIDTTQATRAVIATENPIPRWDEQTQQVVNEVLLMDGIVWRGGRDQIPIVDSHNDKTVRNIFGSIQSMRVDHATGELIGVPVFASDSESQTIAMRMQEGHITDFSITGQPLATTFVARGQSYTTSRGVVIDGPALIHTQWQPQNASICATGADEQSTVRRSYTDLNRRITRMDEALLGQLSGMGLPDGMTDPNQVLAWVVGKLGDMKKPEAEEVEHMAEEVPAEAVKPIEKMYDSKPVENMADETKPVEEEVARAADPVEEIKRSLKADQARRTEIQSACKLARIERAFADELCDGFVSLNDARKRIIERMATQPLGASVGADVRVTESADDKFYAAARDGLLMRAKQSAGVKRSLTAPTPSAGAEDFQYASLMRTAEMFVRRMGANVDRMAPKDIALVAMGHAPTINRLRIQRSDNTYHSTGSFSNLMLDAASKTLLAGYEEAEYTWNIWARTAPAVADFKNVNRIRFSEVGNLEMVPELADYPEETMSDSKESYKVEKFGSVFSVSWETIINDDLDAISRIPAMQGNAARRTQNAKVYEVLTSNPTMGDGVALFGSHTSGTNTSGSAAAPGVTTLNTAFTAMRRQKGLNNGVTLNLTPRFLIVPVEYEATAMELFSSTSYNAANNNEGVRNIYGPGGGRTLTIVADSVLTSSVQWYLAADTARIDTVELAYLQGEESPVLENEWNMKNDSYLYKIRQTFGVKAIDWRGLYRNAA
jgi:hypothetical protein